MEPIIAEQPILTSAFSFPDMSVLFESDIDTQRKTAAVQTSPEATYPSVTLAFELSKGSYDIILKRLDAVETRLQNLLQTVAGFTTAVIAFIASNNQSKDFFSVWFIIAMAAFGIGMTLGVYARVSGKILAIDPDVLYQRWLEKSEWTFRKDYIFFAGQHFKTNVTTVEHKSFLTALVAMLFGLEAIMLVCWVLKP